MGLPTISNLSSETIIRRVINYIYTSLPLNYFRVCRELSRALQLCSLPKSTPTGPYPYFSLSLIPVPVLSSDSLAQLIFPGYVPLRNSAYPGGLLNL